MKKCFYNYMLCIINQGNGAVDNDSLVITDPIPENTSLFVNDMSGPGSGPVLFTDGPVSSGLIYTFISLESMTDDIDFSNNSGVTYTYIPVPDADGYDDNVTHIRIFPKGIFEGNSTPPAPSFDLRFKVKVH